MYTKFASHANIGMMTIMVTGMSLNCDCVDFMVWAMICGWSSMSFLSLNVLLLVLASLSSFENAADILWFLAWPTQSMKKCLTVMLKNVMMRPVSSRVTMGMSPPKPTMGSSP